MASDTVLYVEGDHFYQPNRRSPLDALADVETCPDGTDYSERGWEMVYRSLGDLLLYEHMSYDFAPPLQQELERVARVHDTTDPDVAAAIRATHHEMCRCLRTNGIATPEIHAIHPHLSELDKRILIRAGIQNYRAITGEAPLAFWLPEGGVDYPTLQELALNGIQAFICAPEQINNDHPRRIQLADGLQIIAIPFDTVISRKVAFDPERRTNADHFVTQFVQGVVERRRQDHDPWPVVTWKDGETYGNYDERAPGDPGSDYFLEYMVREALPRIGVQVITLNQMVRQFLSEPQRIEEGWLNPNTAWSCSDGLVRWSGERDCIESGGATWKRPFYDAHAQLNNEVTDLVRHELGLAGHDNDDEFVYRMVANFETAFLNPGGHRSSVGASLMSAKVAALAARASCGTFYAELRTSGWQNMVFARTAVEHLRDAGLTAAADKIWARYLRTLHYMPAHHLEAGPASGPRTALHLVAEHVASLIL